ncbi:IS5/IS1182 family transposase [Chroococcidiopsis sp. CCALA 051]|uniref:IS1182 family transposase n=1 Tax=Chroococcidiopsis sp. CCALA 051 TaxID=869949 RepID=UPI000D0CCDC0|nr:IS1182 family transposase [Chroococcidiopsis sp. CCALA 051]PSM45462.1 IS5/IS1182 family transposase [Chroococcidiopsis sp. CCALA 051]
MCLHPEEIPPVPEQTVRVALAAFPKGNLYMRLRDELGVFYQDEDFASLYPQRGQPALAPWRLAMVLVMQFLENMSDRQAAQAVQGRIDWKYALSLELTDPGFDFSVLSEFRDRIIEGDVEQQILNLMLKRFQELKLLRARGKQRTDSTHILAVVRELTRLEHLGETLRSALNAVAEIAPIWLKLLAPAEWYDRYSKRFEDSRLPRTAPERETLAVTIGADGFQLLDAIYSQTAPVELRQLPAVEVLRQVWVQQYYAPTDKIQLRNEKDGPPSALRIRSPYDLEARNSTKRTTNWTGYKVHLTESCDENLPHIITHVESTPATSQDQTVVPSIHRALDRKDLLPQQHLVDSGYTSAQLLSSSERDYNIDLCGPVALNVGWQAKAGLGFDLSHFQIDWKQKAVYCPQGKRSYLWKKNKDGYGKPVIYVEFRQRDCLACPVRSQCTRAKTNPRGLTIQTQSDYEALQKARERQKTEQFQKQYALRSGIEATISQGIRAFELRECRYIGLAKTHLQHIVTAAAINLGRVFAWLEEIPLAKTRSSHFTLLAEPNI